MARFAERTRREEAPYDREALERDHDPARDGRVGPRADEKRVGCALPMAGTSFTPWTPGTRPSRCAPVRNCRV